MDAVWQWLARSNTVIESSNTRPLVMALDGRGGAVAGTLECRPVGHVLGSNLDLKNLMHVF